MERTPGDFASAGYPWLDRSPAMVDDLLLTLPWNGVAEGSAEGKRAVEGATAGLVADLSGRAAMGAGLGRGEEREPGRKSPRLFQLRVFTARVSREKARKVVHPLWRD